MKINVYTHISLQSNVHACIRCNTIHCKYIDKCQDEGAEECFKSVSAAYKCLETEEKRRHYNMTGTDSDDNGHMGGKKSYAVYLHTNTSHYNVYMLVLKDSILLILLTKRSYSHKCSGTF